MNTLVQPYAFRKTHFSTVHNLARAPMNEAHVFLGASIFIALLIAVAMVVAGLVLAPPPHITVIKSLFAYAEKGFYIFGLGGIEWMTLLIVIVPVSVIASLVAMTILVRRELARTSCVEGRKRGRS